jgi:hypothetical protein
MPAPDDFILSLPAEMAVYLPAVQDGYAKVAEMEVSLARPLPPNFSLGDLEFWSGNSRLWNHKALLHSIGCYPIGSDTRGSLFSRAPGSFTMLGDSGGFQIGKGSFKGLKGFRQGMSGVEAVAAWADSYDAKCWIIRWLDHHCDWAITLDMPLWALDARGSASPFHLCSEQQLLTMTNDNLKLIEQESGGGARWINVVQGGGQGGAGSVRRWWDGVKWFRRGGWALAGEAGWLGGIHAVLSTVLMMRDEDAFGPGQDWLHVLGVSTAVWGVVLTAIQRELRSVNPRLQVSYDSASPFIEGGRYETYALPPDLGADFSGWSMKSIRLEGLRSHANPDAPVPFPVSSPLGDQLMMHHLIIDDAEHSARRNDTLSNMMLINHNIWVYLDAARRANAAAFGGAGEIPADLTAVLAVIGEAFASSDWQRVIAEHKPLLDRVAGPA